MNAFMKNGLAVSAVSAVAAMLVAPAMAEETRTVVDQRGIEVQVPKVIKRMAVFPGPLPSVVFAIDGSTKSIVGAHDWSVTAAQKGMMATMSPEILDAKTDFVESKFDVNIEEMLELDPDVVLAWVSKTDTIAALEAAGLPVIAIDLSGGVASQDDFEEWLRIVGELFDNKQRADKLATMQREIVAEVTSRVAEIENAERPRSLLIWKIGKGLIEVDGGQENHHYFWLDGSGSNSVAKDLPGGSGKVSMEQILEWNPEVIYLRNWNDLTPQMMYDNEIEGQDWSQIDAVKNGRVYKIPLGVYVWSSPNAERALILKWAAKRNFPEKFADIDISKVITDFYDEFFDYDLAEAEINKILHFDLNGEL